MNKFRKKPVVIEATQWFKNGDHPEDDVFRPFDSGVSPAEPQEGLIVRYFRGPDLPDETTHGVNPVTGVVCDRKWHDHGWIDTAEGGHIVCPGDWIITGVQGEHYPCKPDIFDATYEAVK